MLRYFTLVLRIKFLILLLLNNERPSNIGICNSGIDVSVNEFNAEVNT